MTVSASLDSLQSPAAAPPARHWLRRRWYWFVISPLLIVLFGMGLLFVEFQRTRSQTPLLDFLSNHASLETVETPRTIRFYWVLDTLGKIPGFDRWISPAMEKLYDSRGFMDYALLMPDFEDTFPLTPEQFTAITKTRNFVEVDFSDRPLTPEQFQQLSRMTWLTGLGFDLSSCTDPSETDPIFAALDSIQGLTVLHIHLHGVTPAAARWIAQQRLLDELHLTVHQGTPEILTAIAPLSRLRTLRISCDSAEKGQTKETTTSKSTLSNLQLNFPHLQDCFLGVVRGAKILSDESIHAILQNRSLQTLSLVRIPLSETLTRDLANLPDLQTLGLCDVELSADQLRTITAPNRLTALDLSGCDVDPGALDILRMCTQFKTLRLRHLKQPLPQMKTLQREGLQLVTDESPSGMSVTTHGMRKIFHETP